MQPAVRNIEMRTDPSMNQHGDVGSPHISRMEGDLSKINPIQHQNNISSTEYASRDNHNTSYTQRYQFGNIENINESHMPIIRKSYHEESTTPLTQSELWSNVVSSNSPIKLAQNLDETAIALTNSTTSKYQKMEYIKYQSRSFDANEDRSQDLNYLPRSMGFKKQNVRPQNSWGMSLPHPPPYRDGNPPQLPTICQGVQAPSTPLHSPMMHSTPHRSYECFSPFSLCDSTDQTTPLSSPSMSPCITPMQGHHEPPMWQLSSSPNNNMNSDSKDFHAPTGPLRFRPPEQIRYEHNRAIQGYIHHRSYGSSPAPPPNHGSNATPHSHHSSQTHRTGLTLSSSINRSSTEVLKTLLRKKACLYEPETSSAVALITWLVGRRLAITYGFFTRQQLQSGVHSCVQVKIKEGHATRTKVNRCMQIILNSCFHYIIPRSDGSEESGDLFRETFFKDATNDERLLQMLPPPWHNLNLNAINTDERSVDTRGGSVDDASYHLARNQDNSLSVIRAGESTDSGKPSVLLCFNENIRSAADVFRCHNEFIRDAAHMAKLNLSADDWKMFFSGGNLYKKGNLITEASAQRYFHFVRGIPDGNERMDQQGIASFHTTWCAKRYDHDQSLCSFAHMEINRGWLRRDPFIYKYKPVLCTNITHLEASEDCFVNACPQGVMCSFAHSREEVIYHPESYKKNPCSNTANLCRLKDICPNTHTSKPNGFLEGASHGFARHGKRHHTNIKRTEPKNQEQSTGFVKRPEGSPMLYIDPAPISKFEEALLLPGLKALFRDFSNSICNSSHQDREYGLFGFKPVDKGDLKQLRLVPIGPIGKPETV